MARVKRGVTAHARHKKVLGLAKGYRGRGSTAYGINDPGVIVGGAAASGPIGTEHAVFWTVK